ncbi:EAL domain-containing protein [Buttiauxella izardii]|uniref:cyclic-guanylate-specific phosphodiesterase n=1 Tax=Buttiauxella izardii TaxID=82991 RepID=A0A3A5JW51_9ENTR|nr:EAL domain-containing protein [Buttiauxella izardii]RJT26297.1 EAL domain-containing protein [Buttiauxella izardii]
MTTRKLISLVSGVLILAVLLPILLSVYFAHRNAEAVFHEELAEFADHAMFRTGKVVEQAVAAIDEINQVKDLTCSSAHAEAMHRVSLKYRYVQEVMFQENNHILCTSLEAFNQSKPIDEPDRIGPDGYSAWYTTPPTPGFKRKMVYIGKPPHLALIDPMSFIDILPFGKYTLNIAMVGLGKNQLIASNSHYVPDDWRTPLTQGVDEFQSDDDFYIIRRDNELGLAMIAWASREPMSRVWYEQLFIWLPIGLVISLAAGAFLVSILRRLLSPRNRLMDAIKNHEISVVYQPIVHLQSGESVGAEALIRWQQADGSMLNPDVFIPLAEQTGLVTQLTEQVIEHIFTELGDWLNQHPDHHISVNLGVSDVHSLHILEVIHPYLARYSVKPGQIAFEITERGFADPKITAPIIAQYRKAGHAIYIDDFGTGYSSLSYLQDLDVDILKIDKSFVDALEYKNVTPHIIEMANALGILMVAEGIETPRQATWLREQGVQYGQGWLFSKALAKDDFIQWVASDRARRVKPSSSIG